MGLNLGVATLSPLVVYDPLLRALRAGAITLGCEPHAHSPVSETTYHVNSPAVLDLGSRRGQERLFIPKIDHVRVAGIVASFEAFRSQLPFSGHEQRAPV